MISVLVVEDDPDISKNLAALLRSRGFTVTAASGCAQALSAAAAQRFDVSLIDVSLPDGNGFSVCTALKELQGMPVIFLTAADDEASVVTGLNMGADDYVTKPFRPLELIARMRAALRRGSAARSVRVLGPVTVDTAAGKVTRDGSEVFLSALEYRLLLAFLSNQGGVLTRSRLLDELWDASGEFVNDNTLSVYVRRLREKLETDPANPELILTVRGAGYRLGGRFDPQ